MAIENIKNSLEQRFDEPLPEYYKRKIIFWYDENGEFVDEIEQLTLSNAKVLVLTENNNFEIKRILNHDDLTSNYLVYNPLMTDMEDDWLLDIKLYSEEFRADQMSMWMQEMNIINIPAIFTQIKKYKEFLKAASRRNQLAKFSLDITSTTNLHLAILASICGVKHLEPKEIIRAVMLDGNDTSNNLKMDLLKYDASNIFWKMVNNTTGYNSESVPNIDDMDIHIVLSALTKTIHEKYLIGLESRYNSYYSAKCYDIIYEWLHSDNREDLVYILRFIENELRLTDRFEKLEIKDLLETEILPCIDEIILNKLILRFINNTANIDEIISVIEKRRTMVWYEYNKPYYDAILNIAKMQQFYEQHMDGFHHTSSRDIWKSYVDDYYKMDSYYRQFVIAFSDSLNIAHPMLDDNFRVLVENAERLYKVAYLDKLAENWTNLIEEDLKDTGKIQGIPQQTDFYQREVASSDNKIFVIISDALRYEVAAQLASKLKFETKSDVKLGSQQSVFPSKTDLGMSALLPHLRLSLENLKVLADGESTEASNREAILKKANEKSVAISYDDFIRMKQTDQKEFVKGQEVVYIYHNKIDKTGHNDELNVFGACEDTIEDIFNLIKMITSRLSGINIVVTADHGFLYTYEPLKPIDKMNRDSFRNHILQQGRRYVITSNDADIEEMIEVKGFYNKNNYKAFAPRETIRIKSSGGQNFVHGGISLQELVVPVIKYKFLRAGSKAYENNKDKYDTKPVTLTLLNTSRKISNMIFNLSFYQKEPVKDNFIPCTYNIYLTDSNNNIISDVQKIVADRTSTENTDREYRCTFNLKQQAYSNTEIYYLVISDEKGIGVPIKEEVQIDISMAFFDDFDLFS